MEGSESDRLRPPTRHPFDPRPRTARCRTAGSCVLPAPPPPSPVPVSCNHVFVHPRGDGVRARASPAAPECSLCGGGGCTPPLRVCRARPPRPHECDPSTCESWGPAAQASQGRGHVVPSRATQEPARFKPVAPQLRSLPSHPTPMHAARDTRSRDFLCWELKLHPGRPLAPRTQGLAGLQRGSLPLPSSPTNARPATTARPTAPRSMARAQSLALIIAVVG